MPLPTIDPPFDPADRDPREPIHQLNGHLLEALKKLIPDPEAKWSEWVMNVIMLHRNVGAGDTVTLETSATWRFDEMFCSRDDCQRRGQGKVSNLDGYVPMNKSYAGYCIREGNIVWVDDVKTMQNAPASDLDDSPLASEPDPLQEKYRSFSYVGVKTPGLPRSEYVFPIRLRIGLSAAQLGVLNCEWFGGGDGDQNVFQKLRRTRAAHLLTHLLDVHARFVPLAYDRMRAAAGDWTAFLKQYYDPCMDQHIERIIKGAPE